MDSGATAAPVAAQHRAALARPHDQTSQAYHLLHWGFVVVPLVAGLDKLFHVMTDWNVYLCGYATNLLGQAGISVPNFMMGVGALEIMIAMLVAFKPRVGAYLVALWLAAIIANLVMLQGSFDVMLRDFGLFLAALAFGRLSHRSAT